MALKNVDYNLYKGKTYVELIKLHYNTVRKYKIIRNRLQRRGKKKLNTFKKILNFFNNILIRDKNSILY